jgi:hypothetical protein
LAVDWACALDDDGEHGLFLVLRFVKLGKHDDGEGGYKSVILNLNSESKSGKSSTKVNNNKQANEQHDPQHVAVQVVGYLAAAIVIGAHKKGQLRRVSDVCAELCSFTPSRTRCAT